MGSHCNKNHIYAIYHDNDIKSVKPILETIESKLKEKNIKIRIWKRYDDMPAGGNIQNISVSKIRDSIINIIFLSKHINENSKYGFYYKEIEKGLEFNGNFNPYSEQIGIIPIKIDEKLSRKDIPEKLQELHHINIFRGADNGGRDSYEMIVKAIQREIYNRGLEFRSDNYFPNKKSTKLSVSIEKTDGKNQSNIHCNINTDIFIDGELSKKRCKPGTPGAIIIDYNLLTPLLTELNGNVNKRCGHIKSTINKIGDNLNFMFFKQTSHRFSDRFDNFLKLKKDDIGFSYTVFEMDWELVVDFPIDFLMNKDDMIFLKENNFLTFKKYKKEKFIRDPETNRPLRYKFFEAGEETDFHIILSNSLEKSVVSDNLVESNSKYLIEQATDLFNLLLDFKNEYGLNVNPTIYPTSLTEDKITKNGLRNYLDHLHPDRHHVIHFIGQGVNDDNGSKIILSSIEINEEWLKKIANDEIQIPKRLINLFKGLENKYFSDDQDFFKSVANEYGPEFIHTYSNLLHELLDKHPLPMSKKENVLVDLGEFAEILREKKIRFVYLNCCYGAIQKNSECRNNVFGLMDSLIYHVEIPSVLGFRWPVICPSAKEFAIEFYTDFFINSRYIPEAFHNTRLNFLNDEDSMENDKFVMGISPVLVYQEDING